MFPKMTKEILYMFPKMTKEILYMFPKMTKGDIVYVSILQKDFVPSLQHELYFYCSICAQTLNEEESMVHLNQCRRRNIGGEGLSYLQFP